MVVLAHTRLGDIDQILERVMSQGDHAKSLALLPIGGMSIDVGKDLCDVMDHRTLGMPGARVTPSGTPLPLVIGHDPAFDLAHNRKWNVHVREDNGCVADRAVTR
jgi:hypothetical protein